MNLPASLMPQLPDGSPQMTATAADDPGLLALFEQAMGLHVEPAAQAPGQQLGAATAAKVGVPIADQPIGAQALNLPLTPAPGIAQNALSVVSPQQLPSGTFVVPAAGQAVPGTPALVETIPSNVTAATIPAATVNTDATKPIETSFFKASTHLVTDNDAAQPLLNVQPRETGITASDLPPLGAKAINTALPGEAKAAAASAPAIHLDQSLPKTAAPTAEVTITPLGAAIETATSSAGPDVIRAAAATNPAQEPQAMAQVRDMIRAGTKSGTIEVQLDPPELGRVVIELEVGRQGQVKAVISASESDTLDLMRRNADTLAGDLKDGGFEDVELDWQQSDQPSGDDDGQEPPWLLANATQLAQQVHTTHRHDGSLDIQL